MAVLACCDPARLTLTQNSENVLGCSVYLITSGVRMLWGTSTIFLLFPPPTTNGAIDCFKQVAYANGLFS